MAQLNVSKINKRVKEVNKKNKHVLKDGSELTYNPVFSETKIEELLEDFQQLLQESKEREIELSDRITFHLIQLLCIKHFTHLKKDFMDGLDNHLEFLNKLVDGEYFKEITEEVFSQVEFNKVLDKMAEVMGRNNVLGSLLAKAQLKAQEIQNANQSYFDELEK